MSSISTTLPFPWMRLELMAPHRTHFRYNAMFVNPTVNKNVQWYLSEANFNNTDLLFDQNSINSDINYEMALIRLYSNYRRGGDVKTDKFRYTNITPRPIVDLLNGKLDTRVNICGVSILNHTPTDVPMVNCSRYSFTASQVQYWGVMHVYVIWKQNRNRHYLARCKFTLLNFKWTIADELTTQCIYDVAVRFWNLLSRTKDRWIESRCYGFDTLAFCQRVFINFCVMPLDFIVHCDIGTSPSREQLENLARLKLNAVYNQFKTLTVDNILNGWRATVRRRLFDTYTAVGFNHYALEILHEVCPDYIDDLNACALHMLSDSFVVRPGQTFRNISPSSPWPFIYLNDIPFEFRMSPRHFAHATIDTTRLNDDDINECDSDDSQSTFCRVCLCRRTNYLLLPCRHAVCKMCSLRVNFCPFCQTLIVCGCTIFV